MPGVRVEDRGAVRHVVLDRAPANVLDLATIGELHGALAPLAGRADLKVVVLSSALPGTFSAGVDVRDHTRARVAAMLDAFHGVIRLMDVLPQPTVAAVDGRCLGGACELAAFCDVVLASPRATFAVPEIDVGCFPPLAAVLFPRLAGRAAAELVLGGATVDAAEAARIGLVSRVVDDLPAEVERVSARLAAKSGAVLALARRAVRRGGDGPLAEALARSEALYRERLVLTEDVEEGVRAFLDKRPPRWTDR
jgi:cyclohexa-1,5-dienecarbonyl-CoA hydratase